MMRQILIAGIGNIFLGDDGFGSEVARRLLDCAYPDGVRVVDIGIRGMDLAFLLLDDYDAVIFVDAVPRGGVPGTLYLIEPELPDAGPETGGEAGRQAIEAHNMDPVKVLAFAKALGARPTQTLIVGCEPGPIDGDDDEMRMGLSAPVHAAVDGAAYMVDELVQQLLSERAGVKS